jgi:CO/xanthine dehydrogenase FAD-binding subunit
MGRVLAPRSLDEALATKARHPDAVPIAGGTDVMVAVNAGRLRPPAFMDITRVPELDVLTTEDGFVFVGAGVTYARMAREPASLPAALLQAARTVGSPQIRARGTMGGNLGTASPAGDTLPPISALGAEVVVASAERGRRFVPIDEFLVGPKRTALEPDELIVGARWADRSVIGSFSKVGVRNAMVIAVASLCLLMDAEDRTVRVALGSVGPVVLRAHEAEAFAADALSRAGAWDDPSADVPESVIEDFAQLVADAARPIDDLRGTAVYRRHACRVMARRALRWALTDHAAADGHDA